MIIGHRGVKGHVAENTMASIEKALEFGVDGIEIDVFRIKSGEIVVFHDEKLRRLTGANGMIEDQTLEQVRKLRVKGRYPIPTLEEVLQRLDGKVLLNIELKGEGTAGPVFDLLTAFYRQSNWSRDKILISSFNWKELDTYRALDPEMAIGVLTENDLGVAIEKGKTLGALSINADHHLLNEQSVKQIREAGLQVWCWTANRLPDLERMFELEVDAIITDYPDRVMD
ncbi:glycerophosphodiester phosphodiesterase [Robertkochia flava]|uniref:glycerophosphodiester phosphodiesterase n=1 Tax=Robertkochia flava TaxID=3447986 RepID=UPI001CCFD351|nr:glycerophosphodiester phosphodiesterase family protein [Robertkochia marina]